MNLKPEELVKALQLCGWYRDCDCENCPADDESDDWCHDTILSLAADQIERDQKEIAELKAKVEQYRALIPSWVIPMTPKED